MDIETRIFLKEMVERTGYSQLLQSVLQRFGPQMSEAEGEAMLFVIRELRQNAVEYLGIDEEGRLIVTDPEERKKFGLDPITEEPEAPEAVPEPEGGTESKAPAQKDTKKKKDSYS